MPGRLSVPAVLGALRCRSPCGGAALRGMEPPTPRGGRRGGAAVSAVSAPLLPGGAAPLPGPPRAAPLPRIPHAGPRSAELRGSVPPPIGPPAPPRPRTRPPRGHRHRQHRTGGGPPGWGVALPALRLLGGAAPPGLGSAAPRAPHAPPPSAAPTARRPLRPADAAGPVKDGAASAAAPRRIGAVGTPWDVGDVGDGDGPGSSGGGGTRGRLVPPKCRHCPTDAGSPESHRRHSGDTSVTIRTSVALGDVECNGDGRPPPRWGHHSAAP